MNFLAIRFPGRRDRAPIPRSAWAQAVLIVAGSGWEQAKRARLLGRHPSADLVVGEHCVADDVDLADLQFRPLADLEHHVDAVLVESDHLWIDDRGEAALAAIALYDPADILPDRRARKNLARGELDFLGDLIAFQRLLPSRSTRLIIGFSRMRSTTLPSATPLIA
jgi:hypothetical protein